MIGIIDYGTGNIASVQNAFEYIGQDVCRCTNPFELTLCKQALLPGVGSFSAAMEALNAGGWVQAIQNFALEGKPLLGICLGMQLLFDIGEEHGPSNGLGLIPGEVIKLEPTKGTKLPHVGWNSLVKVESHPLLKGIKPKVDVYFVHSFHCLARDEDDVIARCEFGGEFVAAVARGNIAGMQFHPEKSQPSGLRILENFAEWDGKC